MANNQTKPRNTFDGNEKNTELWNLNALQYKAQSDLTDSLHPGNLTAQNVCARWILQIAWLYPVTESDNIDTDFL